MNDYEALLKAIKPYLEKLGPMSDKIEEIYRSHIGADKTMTHDDMVALAKISGSLAAGASFAKDIEKLDQ